MRIAIVGTGAIGSTFAFFLARAGHEVTVVARGKRLEWLQRERAIVLASGERAAVGVEARLPAGVPFDLVLVTVLATQVEAVLPDLAQSAAKTIMYMFNTFDSLEPLRTAVGPQRAAFGFPAGVFTLLIEQIIRPTVRRGTTVGDASVASVFEAAGIPTVVEPDMQSWLRTHAAMVVPLMTTGVLVASRGRGLSMSEARHHAAGFAAGARAVRKLGNALRPSALGTVLTMPTLVLAPVLWLLSRSRVLRELGLLGAAEPTMLIDMISAAVPAEAEALRAIRPASAKH